MPRRPEQARLDAVRERIRALAREAFGYRRAPDHRGAVRAALARLHEARRYALRDLDMGMPRIDPATGETAGSDGGLAQLALDEALDVLAGLRADLALDGQRLVLGWEQRAKEGANRQASTEKARAGKATASARVRANAIARAKALQARHPGITSVRALAKRLHGEFNVTESTLRRWLAGLAKKSW